MFRPMQPPGTWASQGGLQRAGAAPRPAMQMSGRAPMTQHVRTHAELVPCCAAFSSVPVTT
jgi:hypothetical protein